MKATSLVALVFAGMAAGMPGNSQLVPGTGEAMELTRAALQVKRQEVVTTVMDLTDQESQAFWPLYRDWRAKMAGVGDRKVQIIEQINDQDYDAISDQQSKTILDEWLRIQADSLKLQTQYVKRFRKVLPDKKVARFFQLENKLDAIIAYDLAERLPLVQ